MNNTTVSQSDYIDKHAFDNFDSFILWFLTKWMRKVASVEAIFAALGNLLVLFIILRSKEFHKSYYNWLVIFLAVAEALQGKKVDTLCTCTNSPPPKSVSYYDRSFSVHS